MTRWSGQTIRERASETLAYGGSGGPAERVDHLARLDASGGNFPKFLHADGVGLRIASLIEMFFGDERFGKRSSRTFGEHSTQWLPRRVPSWKITPQRRQARGTSARAERIGVFDGFRAPLRIPSRPLDLESPVRLLGRLPT